MYTFLDKGDRSVTLRPEGTASVARAVLESGMANEKLPQKLFYFSNCFRYEKPQAGRLREFHQFGIECYGSERPEADVETMLIAAEVIEELGIPDITLEINSIGCKDCRAKYREALKEYFAKSKETLCETCKTRLESNPMRILDCKSEVCSRIAKDAPMILDFLCGDCNTHFEKTKKLLTLSGASYIVNPKIVRGLDYYNRTVFEFISNKIGSQGAVCAGGRYDGLCAQIGGVDIPAVGFAMGLERILLALDAAGINLPGETPIEIFIASLPGAEETAFVITNGLRKKGFSAECEIAGRSLKAQLKYADKRKAKYNIVIGENEINENKAILKDMQSGEKREVLLDIDDILLRYNEMECK